MLVVWGVCVYGRATCFVSRLSVVALDTLDLSRSLVESEHPVAEGDPEGANASD